MQLDAVNHLLPIRHQTDHKSFIWQGILGGLQRCPLSTMLDGLEGRGWGWLCILCAPHRPRAQTRMWSPSRAGEEAARLGRDTPRLEHPNSILVISLQNIKSFEHVGFLYIRWCGSPEIGSGRGRWEENLGRGKSPGLRVRSNPRITTRPAPFNKFRI